MGILTCKKGVLVRASSQKFPTCEVPRQRLPPHTFPLCKKRKAFPAACGILDGLLQQGAGPADARYHARNLPQLRKERPGMNISLTCLRNHGKLFDLFGEPDGMDTSWNVHGEHQISNNIKKKEWKEEKMAL